MDKREGGSWRGRGGRGEGDIGGDEAGTAIGGGGGSETMGQTNRVIKIA